MPLPKGINTPQVREAWVAERREKLAEFERLCAGGMGQTKAIRAVGLAPGGLAAMRRSVESLEEGRHVGRSGGVQIDLGLSLLSCLLLPGESLTCEDIAAWCGCSRAAIQSIERRALEKVRRRLGGGPELAREVLALLASR
jgi:hypothetical protein